MSAILELDHVSKSYSTRARPAVDDLTLAIEPGEFVTLLGPSGCGKTTTLRIMAGFEAADRGRVRISGADVTEVPAFRRPQIHTMFQEYALFPHMTVAENVGYGLRVAGWSRAEIEQAVSAALGMVGLPDRAAARPRMLSGGQRQRVALARALVRKPKVLLLDEPLSALDVKLRDAMQAELRALHRQLGITFVMVTHDQKEALVMSDRIAVMRTGKIAQIGAPKVLYDKPASPYVADFVGAANILSGRVLARRGAEVEVAIGSQSILGRIGGAGRPEVGERVVVAIRPEALRPGTEGNGLEAQLGLSLFHGNLNRLDFAVAGTEQHLSVEMPRHGGELAPGARVRLLAEPGAVLVYAEDDR